eukprot:scaffold1816_cov134-Isochrysis_galbana.AAC.4
MSNTHFRRAAPRTSPRTSTFARLSRVQFAELETGRTVSCALWSLPLCPLSGCGGETSSATPSVGHGRLCRLSCERFVRCALALARRYRLLYSPLTARCCLLSIPLRPSTVYHMACRNCAWNGNARHASGGSTGHLCPLSTGRSPSPFPFFSHPLLLIQAVYIGGVVEKKPILAFLATGQHGAAELRVGPDGRLSGRATVTKKKTCKTRLKKPRLPSALGLSGACGEEAY